MSSWGNFFGKVADQFQGRIERAKNERLRLVNERKNLMAGQLTDFSSRRVATIDDRLREIQDILTTKASD